MFVLIFFFNLYSFYMIFDVHCLPHSLKGLCRYCFHMWCPGGWVGGRKKVCPSCVSETVKCRKLIHGRDIGWSGVGHGVILI